MRYVVAMGAAAAILAASAQLAAAEDSQAEKAGPITQATQVAQAPPPGAPPMGARPWLAPSPWYVSLTAAAAFPNDTSFTVGPFSGAIEYGTGVTAFIGLGYRVTPWISAELEVGYLYMPVNQISANAATASVDGSLRGFAAFGNAVLTYPEIPYMTPYIAAGAGIVHRFDTDITVGGLTSSVGSSTDFAMQAKAGVDFRLTGSMSIAPEYRYMFINTSGDGFRNTHVHSVGASLKIRF